MQSILRQYGWFMYGGLNLAVLLTLVVGSVTGGGSISGLPYVMLFFALCSSAIPFVRNLNGPFAMLGVIGGVYFLGFGLSDALAMFSPEKNGRPSGAPIDAGEAVLLVGMLMQVIGFHIGVRLTQSRAQVGPPKDWPRALFLPLGLILWCAGISALLYQSLVVQADNSNAAVIAGFSKLGVWNTTGLILVENYAGPLGIVILSYWWTKWARRSGTPLMLLIILVQFAAGWVVDQKETSLNGPVVILLTRFVVEGKVPMRWLVCSALATVLVFPVLTAKRVIMTEGLGLTRAQALARTGEILERAIAERVTARENNKYEQKTQTFLERATDKAAVEVFVQHVGVDHPYQLGATLDAMLYAFIPRVFWSDKPGDNSAVTFNREFKFSADPDTHISPTHIGELYWNFGLPGVIIGMALIGVLLGYTCGRFDPSVRPSISGVLVIIVTLYELVARFEGQIELQYVVWARTLVLIGLLHILLARPLARATQNTAGEPNGAASGADAPLRYPNLVR